VLLPSSDIFHLPLPCLLDSRLLIQATKSRRRTQWTLLKTLNPYTGYEQRVQQNLKQRIATFQHPELIDQVTLPINHPPFPGYVLVHMQLTDATWAIVRATAGVTKGCQPQPYGGITPS
jgi:hypothetical protein